MTALRVANCSGFYGDRLSAAAEMVGGGDLDVLTGDWLAELTMGLLVKERRRDPELGYARTFLAQCEAVLAPCLARGIRIVSNAGGLNPWSCAERVREIGARLGLSPRVAVVHGDDLTDRLGALTEGGWEARHLGSGVPFAESGLAPGVASAYLGGRGIAAALAAGADVVVTGRVADASLVVGPAAWRFGWAFDEWDALAGAVAAGHVIECGAQATGGNFSFFPEVPDPALCGFPLAEVAADGSSVITKHPGTGGMVTPETVTAQLLYEVQDERYVHPDVVLRLDSLVLEQDGPDRVRIRGARGEPAPAQLKVGLVCSGGWRAATTFFIPGDRVREKARLAEDALWAAVPGGRSAFASTSSTLVEGEITVAEGRSRGPLGLLRVAVAAPTAPVAGQLSRAAVGSALGSYPGLYFADPPGKPREYMVFWPALLDREQVPESVTIDGETRRVDTSVPAGARAARTPPDDPPGPAASAVPDDPPGPDGPAAPDGPTARVAFGELFGTRSGDKAGSATLGIWARDRAAYDWLRSWLSAGTLAELLPPGDAGPVRWAFLPNLRAVIVTVGDYLGAGVDANLDLDSQAKGLGEYVRSRVVAVPARLAGGRSGR